MRMVVNPRRRPGPVRHVVPVARHLHAAARRHRQRIQREVHPVHLGCAVREMTHPRVAQDRQVAQSRGSPIVQHERVVRHDVRGRQCKRARAVGPCQLARPVASHRVLPDRERLRSHDRQLARVRQYDAIEHVRSAVVGRAQTRRVRPHGAKAAAGIVHDQRAVRLRRHLLVDRPRRTRGAIVVWDAASRRDRAEEGVRAHVQRDAPPSAAAVRVVPGGVIAAPGPDRPVAGQRAGVDPHAAARPHRRIRRRRQRRRVRRQRSVQRHGTARRDLDRASAPRRRPAAPQTQRIEHRPVRRSSAPPSGGAVRPCIPAVPAVSRARVRPLADLPLARP